jgi:hypothetical protein
VRGRYRSEQRRRCQPASHGCSSLSPPILSVTYGEGRPPDFAHWRPARLQSQSGYIGSNPATRASRSCRVPGSTGFVR